MKKVVMLCGIMVLISCMSSEYKPPENNPLSSVTNFMVYYGQGFLDKLKQYDLLILQPELYTSSEVSEMKKVNSIPVAYLSLGEIETTRWWAEKVNDSWLLGKNEVWGSYYIDPGNPAWKSLVIDVIIPSIIKKGYCGLFLDTIDMVDLYPNAKTDMVELIKSIREEYPDLILIQNRGFSIFSQSGELIDGILFESMTSSYNFDTQSSFPVYQDELIRSTRRIAEKYGVALFALDYLSSINDESSIKLQQRFYNKALRYNYIPLIRDISLHELD